MIQNDLLYSKKPVIIVGGNDRRIHNNYNEVYRTDDNVEDQQDKFGAQIDTKYVYRVPLKYFCNFGKIDIPTKIELKIRCTLQTEMKKLFQSEKKLYLLGLPSFNARKFCLREISDNILRQQCCPLTSYILGYKKHRTKKHTNFWQIRNSSRWALRDARDSLIGLKFH